MHYVSKILLFLIFTGVKTYKKRIGNGNFGDDAYCTHSADRAGCLGTFDPHLRYVQVSM